MPPSWREGDQEAGSRTRLGSWAESGTWGRVHVGWCPRGINGGWLSAEGLGCWRYGPQFAGLSGVGVGVNGCSAWWGALRAPGVLGGAACARLSA